jgi:ribulose bisphosphate carboxylase small subunit
MDPKSMGAIANQTVFQVIDTIREDAMYKRLQEGNHYTFDTFKDTYLCKRSVIALYDSLLTCLPTHLELPALSIHARDFMVAYLFTFFDTDETMKEASAAVIRCLHEPHVDTATNEYLCTLYQLVLDYQTKYVLWKPGSKHDVLQQMTTMFWEMELIFQLNVDKLPPEELDELYTQKSQHQTKYLRIMKGIDNLHYFYSYIPIVFDPSIVDQIHTILKQAFWNNIKQGFRNTPPKIEALFPVFSEIRVEVQKMFRRKPPSFMEHFNEMIDEDFFKQLAENQLTPVDFWKNRCVYLHSLLLEMDSMAMEAEHNRFFTNWQQELAECRAAEEARKDGGLLAYDKCVDYLAYFMEHMTKVSRIFDEFTSV